MDFESFTYCPGFACCLHWITFVPLLYVYYFKAVQFISKSCRRRNTVSDVSDARDASDESEDLHAGILSLEDQPEKVELKTLSGYGTSESRYSYSFHKSVFTPPSASASSASTPSAEFSISLDGFGASEDRCEFIYHKATPDS